MRARLVEIIPVAVYRDEVYTQDGLFELSDETRVRIDDTHKLCDESLLGSTVSIRISATDVRAVHALDEELYELIPDAETTSFERLAGRVDEVIERSDSKVVFDVDVGYGTIRCTVHRSDAPEFDPASGEFVVCERVLGVYLESVSEVPP